MFDRDSVAIELANQQGGVITRNQALQIGYSRRQIAYRLEIGRWELVQALGYRVIPAQNSEDLLAAAITLLPQAVVSHEAAGAIHDFVGIVDPPPTVSVHSRTTHVFPGVDVRRCHDLHESHILKQGALRVTSIERTAFDLASKYSQARLNWMVGSLVQADRFDMASLEAITVQVGRRGKPGTAKVRSLLETFEVGDGGSPLEERGRRLLDEISCACARMSEYPWPWAPHRRFDDAYPSHRLAIEWDSVKFHGQRDAFEKDRERDRAAVENGWRVLRFTWRHVTETPARLIDSVQRVLSAETCQP